MGNRGFDDEFFHKWYSGEEWQSWGLEQGCCLHQDSREQGEYFDVDQLWKSFCFVKLKLQRSPTSQYFSWADDECWCCSGSRGCAAHLWRGVPGLAMASWSRMVCVSWYSFKNSAYLRSPGSQPPSPRSPVRPTSMGSPQTPVSPPNQVSRVTAR